MPELPNQEPYQPPRSQQPQQPNQPIGQQPVPQQPNQQPAQQQPTPQGQIPQSPTRPSQPPASVPPSQPPQGVYQPKPRRWLKWIGIIIMILLIGGAGTLLWFTKPDKECLNASGYLSSIKHFFKKPTLGDLQVESEKIKNHQIDISSGGMDQTIIVKDNKTKTTVSYEPDPRLMNLSFYKNMAEQQMEMVFFGDGDNNKYYIYLPKLNIYSEVSGVDSDISLSDYYLKGGPLSSDKNMTYESKETVDNKTAYKFKIETGEPGDYENWELWLWSCNGLPLKMKPYSESPMVPRPEYDESTEVKYQYSRFGEITDTEVTLPENARKSDTPIFDF